MTLRQRLRRRAPTVVVLDLVLSSLSAVRRRLRFDAPPRPPHAGRRAVAVGVATAVAATLIGTATLVVTLLRSPEGLVPLGATPRPATAAEEQRRNAEPSTPPSAGPEESRAPRSPNPSTSTTTAAPQPPGATGTTASPAVPVSLTARYARQNTGGSLLSYRASVTIDNPGDVPVTGWTMTITLPRRTLTISDVVGASVRRDGPTWTFTPDSSTGTVPARRSVVVSFQVNGAAGVAANPAACTIDRRPCDGLSG